MIDARVVDPAARRRGRSNGNDDQVEALRQRRMNLRRRYKIQDVIRRRQVLLVQVVKEERGNKGAALTTYLSLAGRYCVLMPNTARGGGISRKITNAADRKKLKDIASELEVPKGAGLIIRTAGSQRTRTEIKRDYEYLMRLWEQIRELTFKSIAPAPIYEEGDLIKRTIRDLYSKDIDEVLVEGERGYSTARDFMKMIMPSHAKNVKLYNDPMPLFARYQVEGYLAGMFNPVVQLKSGGYIVIGVTEALVAIDVNSGRATREASIEETALKTNIEAAEEAARLAGISPERVHREVFGSPRPLDAHGDDDLSAWAPAAVRTASGAEIRWEPAAGFLLDALEAAGVDAPSSCRGGSCGTCVLRLDAGQVAYPVEPAAVVADGEVVTCAAVPDGDVVLGI